MANQVQTTNKTRSFSSGRCSYPEPPLDYPEPPTDWKRKHEIWKINDNPEISFTVYIDPISGREFRSKEEVWKYLWKRISDFDFEDVPETVTFTLDNSNNDWKVECDGVEVSDSERALWAEVTSFVCHWNHHGAPPKKDVDEEEKPHVNIHFDFEPLN